MKTLEQNGHSFLVSLRLCSKQRHPDLSARAATYWAPGLYLFIQKILLCSSTNTKTPLNKSMVLFVFEIFVDMPMLKPKQNTLVF